MFQFIIACQNDLSRVKKRSFTPQKMQRKRKLLLRYFLDLMIDLLGSIKNRVHLSKNLTCERRSSVHGTKEAPCPDRDSDKD